MNNSKENLRFDESIEYDLQKSIAWINFLSVLSYIAMGLMIVLGFVGLIYGLVMLSNKSNIDDDTGAIYLTASILYGIGMSFVFFYVAYWGMAFKNNAELALKSGNQETFRQAFSSLGSYFKFIGIFYIVYIMLSTLFTIVLIAIDI